MRSNTKQKLNRQVAFTLIELLVAASLVGLVILPLLLTSSAVLSTGLLRSASHAKTHSQLSDSFTEINTIFDSATSVVAPNNPTNWIPARYFEISYYNSNLRRAEQIGYEIFSQVVNGETRWFLRKIIDNGGIPEEFSPYSNFRVQDVQLLRTAGEPFFEYCFTNNGAEECRSRNVTSTSTTDFFNQPTELSRTTHVRLVIDGLQVVAEDITRDEGLVMSGAKNFFVGKKFGVQAAGSMLNASFVGTATLAQITGESINNYRPLSISFKASNGTGLVLPTPNSIPTLPTTPVRYLSIGGTEIKVKIIRAVADTLRGNYAFVGQDATDNRIKLYFHNTRTNTTEIIADGSNSFIHPSGNPGGAFNNGLSAPYDHDYPLIIDEFSGRVFWTTRVYGNTQNPFGRPISTVIDPNTGIPQEQSYLVGWDPYRRHLGTFLVHADTTQLPNYQYSLIGDSKNGILWALMDNGRLGSQGITKAVGIDTYEIKQFNHTQSWRNNLRLISGGTNLDYINSWDMGNTGAAATSGDLYLGAHNHDQEKVGMFYLKATRNGRFISVVANASSATQGTHPCLSQTGCFTDVSPTAPSSTAGIKEERGQNFVNRIVVNDANNIAIMLDAQGQGFQRAAGNAPVNAMPLNTNSTQGLPCYPIAGDSLQPRQRQMWYNNNYYMGYADFNINFNFCRGDGSLWVHPTNNPDPFFGGKTNFTQHVVSGNYGTVDNSASGFRINRQDTNATARFFDMGISRSRMVSEDQATHIYGVKYSINPAPVVNFLVSGSDYLNALFNQVALSPSGTRLVPTYRYGVMIESSTLWNQTPATTSYTRHYRDTTFNTSYQSPNPTDTRFHTTDPNTLDKRPWDVTTTAPAIPDQMPWVMSIPKSDVTAFTWFNNNNAQNGGRSMVIDTYHRRREPSTNPSTTYSLIAPFGSTQVTNPNTNPVTTSTTPFSSFVPRVPNDFPERAKKADVIAINEKRMELLVSSVDDRVALWTFGVGREDRFNYPAVNFAAQTFENSRHLRLMSLERGVYDSALIVAEDEQNAYVLIDDYNSETATKPRHIARFRCDTNLKEASSNNSSVCYFASEIELPPAVGSIMGGSGQSTSGWNVPSFVQVENQYHPRVDFVVNQSPDSTEAYLLVDNQLFVIPDRNANIILPRNTDGSIATSWPSGTPTGYPTNPNQLTRRVTVQRWVASVVHSSRTGNFYFLKACCSEGNGRFTANGGNAGYSWNNRTGMMLQAYNSQGIRISDRDILLPLQDTALGRSDIAYTGNLYEWQQAEEARVRLDSQNGLIHLIVNIPAASGVSARQQLYTFQQPAGNPL